MFLQHWQTTTKTTKNKPPVSENHALLHALPEWGFELGCERRSREVEQEGLLCLHCRPTCTRDSLKSNLLGAFTENKDTYGAGKVFASGSHKFGIHSQVLAFEVSKKQRASSCQMSRSWTDYGEGLPELSHKARLIFLCSSTTVSRAVPGIICLEMQICCRIPLFWK